MRYIFLLFLFVFVSCDTRKDYFEDINKAPELRIKSVKASEYSKDWSDSLKYTLPVYNLNYQIVDERPISLQGSSDNSSDLIFINDYLHTTSVKLSADYGLHHFTFKTRDSYNKEAIANLYLTLFKNLPPVPVFYVNKWGVNDPLEYQIYATTSYDQDAKWGGSVVKYEYSINTTYVVTSPYSGIFYIFPSAGLYTIAVRVQDNDGEWSNWKSSVVNVN